MRETRANWAVLAAAALLAACADEYPAEDVEPAPVVADASRPDAGARDAGHDAGQDEWVCDPRDDASDCVVCLGEMCCAEFGEFQDVGKPLVACMTDCKENASCIATCKTRMPAPARLYDALEKCGARYCVSECSS